MEPFPPTPTLFVTGRAATALFLLLRVRFPDGDGEVILPANICHAAVYPVLHAGLQPVLCDVDVRTGNVRLADILQILSPRTRAVVLPHMYGCPAEDAGAIAALCRQNGLVLVEDCASALGADGTGGFGDDVLFSTGHAKTVDLGWGGILCTSIPEKDLRAHETELFPDDEESRSLEFRFGQMYRNYLNSRRSLSEFPMKDFFRADFRRIHLRLPRGGRQELLTAVRQALPAEITRRRTRQKLLEDSFRQSSAPAAGAEVFVCPPGGVPWRFSFFVPPERRPAVAAALLGAGIPVSDWYPSNADFFSSCHPAPNAFLHGRSILNLPLSLPDDDARRAFDLVATALFQSQSERNSS
ncbi:MAG: DegT/DnrJ/EryC1/StrS family aminotransferase [Kiritimatiellae bacterium]|nr:DegT/DnrJ/EryC1/StrS family aminotransferase [Kiritimatiellia bacterium]MBR4189532.1 DegT/DnrJ/EryC1/StrS family aminotransferase [Kiritimatiellia bacterium]